MFDAIIISGGNIHKDFALDFLRMEFEKKGRENVLLVAADKGMDFLLSSRIDPDIVIGDFDSLSEEGKHFLNEAEQGSSVEIVRLKPEKDDSDTQSALMLVKNRGVKSVLILGATGSRLDHVMANLGLLILGKQNGMSVTLVDRNNHISLAEQEMLLDKNTQFGKYVSLFPIGGDVEKLTLEGFKYPLKDYCLKMSDSGLTVSNELCGEQARITYAKGNLLLIMSRD